MATYVWPSSHRPLMYCGLSLTTVLVFIIVMVSDHNDRQISLDFRRWDKNEVQNKYTSDSSKELSKQCKRQANVAYIKTHKTGSTTVQSIIYRFGYIRNLSFVVRRTNPHNGHIRYLKVTEDSPRNMFLPLLGEGECLFRGYNMSAVHVVHNKPVFETFMNPGTKYITILRNPVHQLLSAFVFFNLWKGQKGNTTEEKLMNYMNSARHSRSLYGWNGQSKDLGLKREYYSNDSSIKRFIDRLDNELDLVLINDYFEESVVLLKREFCWDLEDVIYAVQNNRSRPKNTISPELSDRIKAYNRADQLLFEHFNKTFWKRVADQGPEFWKDLEEFRSLRNETTIRCTDSISKPYVQIANKNISNYCDRFSGGLFLFKQVYTKQRRNCPE